MSVAHMTSNTPWPDLTGRMIGEYFLMGKLGKGGLGTVYRVHQSLLDSYYALKVLHLGRFANPDHIARFLREIRIVAKLNHSNIVRAEFAGVEEGLHYLVMELLEGANLSEVMRLHPNGLHTADACELVREAAAGLQYILDHSLIHRDIKPGNLMLTRIGELKILDLGLARSTEDFSSEPLTYSGQVMGTPDFMAPEQCLQSAQIDIRADLYSLGCTLYMLLTGRVPFGGECASPMSKMRAHVESTPTDPLTHRRDLAPGIVAVMMRLLEKEPDDRFQTPAELVAAIEPFAVGADLRALIQSVPLSGTTLDLPPVRRPDVGDPTDSFLPPAKRKVPKIVQRSLKGWMVAASVFAALIVCVVVAFVSSGERGTSSVEKLNIPPFTRMELPAGPEEKWKPDVPYQLLGREPIALRWSGKGAGSHKSIDTKANTFLVGSDEWSFFELARVNEPSFDFGITLKLSGSTDQNGPGIYYALKENPNPVGRVMAYLKCIHVARRRDEMRREMVFQLVRKSLSLGQPMPPEEIPGFPSSVDLAVEEVQPLSPKFPGKLTISIRKRVLTSILWNGVEMANLSKPSIDEQGAFPDATGGIGIVNGGSTIFSNAWLRVLP